MTNDRRGFLKKSAAFTLGAVAAQALGSANLNELEHISESIQQLSAEAAIFTLPELPYAYEALEPIIDKQTMEIHHSRHHKAYVDNLNKALDGKNNTRSIEDILSTVSKEDKAVRNNGGGHYNHSLFWMLMKPNPENKTNPATGKIAEAINSSFGSFDEFKKQFSEAGMKRFGSGWAWLYAENKKLKIGSTPNQDNPLMDNAEIKGAPLLALDVWEHAYYLKHQNKRADYVNNWWALVNWDKVNEFYEKV